MSLSSNSFLGKYIVIILNIFFFLKIVQLNGMQTNKTFFFIVNLAHILASDYNCIRKKFSKHIKAINR